jgi:hypothetical protein
MLLACPFQITYRLTHAAEMKSMTVAAMRTANATDAVWRSDNIFLPIMTLYCGDL